MSLKDGTRKSFAFTEGGKNLGVVAGVSGSGDKIKPARQDGFKHKEN